MGMRQQNKKKVSNVNKLFPAVSCRPTAISVVLIFDVPHKYGFDLN